MLVVKLYECCETFLLREDSNGSPVDAVVFWLSVCRMLVPNVGLIGDGTRSYKEAEIRHCSSPISFFDFSILPSKSFGRTFMDKALRLWESPPKEGKKTPSLSTPVLNSPKMLAWFKFH